MTKSNSTKARKPRTLPKTYKEAIGTITVNAGVMDRLVDRAVWVFLQISPEVGREITEPLISTTRKLNLLKGIGARIIQDERAEKAFHNAYSKLKSAQANRSKIVHAEWAYQYSERKYHILTFEPGETDPVNEPMPLSRLQGIANEIVKAVETFEKFLSSVRVVHEGLGMHHWPPQYSPRPRPSKKKRKT